MTWLTSNDYIPWLDLQFFVCINWNESYYRKVWKCVFERANAEDCPGPLFIVGIKLNSVFKIGENVKKCIGFSKKGIESLLFLKFCLFLVPEGHFLARPCWKIVGVTAEMDVRFWKAVQKAFSLCGNSHYHLK